MMQSPAMQQLRQRVIASYHLGPLDEAETQAYIEHRLKHVGWSGDPSFEPASFALIHAATGGIPRRINTLCNRLLLAGFLAEKRAFGTVDVQSIASEIKEELGSEPAAAPAPLVLASLNANADAAEDAAEAGSWRAHFRRIEERLDRLDRTVGAAVDVLHGLLHPEKLTKPKTPAGR